MANQTRFATAGVVLRIAFRNLLASRAKTAIIGGIILLGAVLVVVGSSLLDSFDAGMRRSIQGSLGGQLQVYNQESKDALAIYGGMMGEPDLKPMEDFAAVKRVLQGVPNVKGVVPMGIDQAMVSTGNLIDVVLAKLRDDARQVLAGDRSPELLRTYQAHQAHVRRMAELLHEELKSARAIVDMKSKEYQERAAEYADLEKALQPGFWAGFEADPYAHLEFLENRIAPLSADNSFTFVRYAGTDLDAFARSFDRLRVVEGQMVPRGQRGILLGKWYADEYLKLRVAHRFDKLKDARDLNHRHIAGDEELQRWVKENAGQTRDLLLQLDPLKAEQARTALQRRLHSSLQELPALLAELLKVDDANFDEHYRIFYQELAPLVRLYAINVGDTIAIKAPTKTGYMKAVSVKVYGFIEFKGLEKSSLAGIMSLLDLMSWRDLYGHLTAEKAREIAELKKAAGLGDLDRDRAEAELFGAPASAPAQTRQSRIDENVLVGHRDQRAARLDQDGRRYGQDEIDQGVALNAAVILEDPTRLRQTMKDVGAAVAKAGLPLKVVTWQEASGMVGQFVTLARLVLWVAVLIIFAVALVIINNAMVMATLQRVKEIGTMRAIGAQRRFVWVMLVVETVAIGLTFGALGSALGVGLLQLIRARGGIPATNEQLYFFFSGPTLMPVVGGTSLAVALVIVFLVSVASALYPAILGTRVTPLEAMASDD
jgi:ABC-type lipoprotein release transport system permease subunit